MAQYDGSIKINTEISTKNAQIQLAALENRMGKTADKIASLREKMNSLKEANIPTQEYQEVSAQIEKARHSLDGLLEKQAQMQSEGKTSGAAWDRLNAKITETRSEIDYAKGELQDLVDTGKAFTLGSDTEEFAKLSQQLQYAENDLAVLNQRHDLLLSKQEKNASGYKNLGDTAKESLDKVDAAVRKTSVSSFGQLGKTVQGTFSKLGLTTAKVSYGIKEMGERAKLSFSKINKSAKKSRGVLGTMASRFKGLALSLLIFNQISKAFDRVTSAVNEGFSNLYADNEKFKESVDELKASVLTLKNSFAAAFRPLVDIAIPYIRMASDYMIELLDKAGQFMSAVTGQKTYTKVIRQTADAFKEAKKAAEGYLSPLDEINKYSPKDEESEMKMGVMFEEAPVSTQFKDMAEKFKETLSKAFTPIREAWEREGQFVIDSWKYGLGEVKDLLGSIGADFAKVWQQEKTVKIFENILHIIGDIGLTAGNLAHNFREAWEENETGLHILENIRDIIGAITENIRHAADTTVEWSKDLDFSPFLTKVQEWTESLVPVFDTLSGIVTDFYEKVLLPLGTWTIEKGLPELLQVLIDFNNRVDWESLRTNLAEFWDHLEPFAETVGEGLLIFISRLAEALANFINSPAFSEFLTMIENWMDKVSPEDVADGFQKIATAIVVLKVASAAIPVISGAFSALSTVAGILKGALSLLSPIISLITPLISGITSALGALASPIGIAIAAIALLAAGFVYLYNTNEDFKNSIDTLYSEHIEPFFDAISNSVSEMKDKFVEFWEGRLKPMLEEWGEKIWELWEDHIQPALGNIFDLLTKLWDEILKPIIMWLFDVFAPMVADVCDIVFDVIDTAVALIADVINGIVDVIEGVIDILLGIITGDWQRVWDGFAEVIDGVAGVIKGIINGIIGVVEGVANAVVAAVNTMIRAINSISFTVPDWVPGVGGESVGFNIPEINKVSIPRLATGAVIPPNKEFLAVLGDQKHGTNIEAPLDTIRQAQKESLIEAFAELGLLGNAGNSNPQTIIIKQYLDRKQVAEAVVTEGKIQQMSTGNNMFLLGTT